MSKEYPKRTKGFCQVWKRLSTDLCSFMRGGRTLSIIVKSAIIMQSRVLVRAYGRGLYAITTRKKRIMWPRIGPIPTYGILYNVGILSFFVVAWLYARRLRLQRRVWIVAGICYLLAMNVGAKALYDVRAGDFHLLALFELSHYTQGGLWGGLLAYLPLSVPVVLLLSKDKLAALDLLALSVPIPWIFAKIGCLLNGCCYGAPCSLPWAITFGQGARGAPPGVPVHPTQIYEILVMVLILVAFRLLRGERWRGTMLLWFLVLYGLGRAATEIWRGDLKEQAHIGPLSISQAICLTVAVLSIVILYLHRRANSIDSGPHDRRQNNRANLLLFLHQGGTP